MHDVDATFNANSFRGFARTRFKKSLKGECMFPRLVSPTRLALVKSHLEIIPVPFSRFLLLPDLLTSE